MKKRELLIPCLIFFGFFLRFFLLPFPGHEHDLAFWKSWSLYGADKGPVELVEGGNFYNYPSFFAVFISAFGKIFALFGNPYSPESYWLTTNFSYLFLFKIITIAGDALIAYLIFKICRPKVGERRAFWLSLFFFLSPVAIFDGAFWGQVDGLGFLFLVLAIYLLKKKKPPLASFVFTLGIFFKLQNIVFAPLFFLYFFWSLDFPTFGRSLGSAILALIMANFPFLLNRKAELIFLALNKNPDYFPYLTLKANNFWALLTKSGYWSHYPDQILLVGISTAKSLGMIAFTLSYLLSTLIIITTKKTQPKSIKNLLLACSLASISFFSLPTQMHDRYLYSFFPLIILYFAHRPLSSKKMKLLVLGYWLFTINYFLNLYASFSFQYQYLGLKWLADFLNGRNFTHLNAVVNSLVFLAFFIYCLKQLPKTTRFLPLLFPIIIFAQNLDYLRYRPIATSSFLSSNWKQSYGQPMKNMSVGSFAGPEYWQRLANNYFFYEQGIGAHAFSEIHFWPNAKFSRFETDYALDNQAGPHSKVSFEVVGDDQLLFRSPPMTKEKLPQHLKLEIKGVKSLLLKINDAKDGISGDHANWLNPVFYR